MAYNLHALNKLEGIMEVSLTKTLAHKFKISVPKVYRRYATTIPTEEGPRKVLQCRVERGGKPPLVATWGGVSLKWSPRATIRPEPAPIHYARSEIVQRLLAEQCELCGSRDNVEVHHIRRLATIRKRRRKELPAWQQVMIARQRKTLVVCRKCHRGPRGIHATQPRKRKRTTGEPDASKVCKSGSAGGQRKSAVE